MKVYELIALRLFHDDLRYFLAIYINVPMSFSNFIAKKLDNRQKTIQLASGD
jgi:hypothetical protein